MPFLGLLCAVLDEPMLSVHLQMYYKSSAHFTVLQNTPQLKQKGPCLAITGSSACLAVASGILKPRTISKTAHVTGYLLSPVRDGLDDGLLQVRPAHPAALSQQSGRNHAGGHLWRSRSPKLVLQMTSLHSSRKAHTVLMSVLTFLSSPSCHENQALELASSMCYQDINAVSAQPRHQRLSAMPGLSER